MTVEIRVQSVKPLRHTFAHIAASVSLPIFTRASCWALGSFWKALRLTVTMLVAMVTAPGRPAWAMIVASRSWFLALRTSWSIPTRSTKRAPWAQTASC